MYSISLWDICCYIIENYQIYSLNFIHVPNLYVDVHVINWSDIKIDKSYIFEF